MRTTLNPHGFRVVTVPGLDGPHAMLLPTRRILVVVELKGRRQTARRIRKALREVRKIPNK